jgi:hypothetical protein
MNRQTVATHWLEKSLALLGAAACLIITIVIWRNVSSYQPMWPLPGLYFLEVSALSLLSAFLFIRGNPYQGFILWGTVGALTAFSILGAFSVGFFYLPVVLIFAIVAITSDVRNRQPIVAHLGVCVLAGLIQAALMLAALRWLYPAAGV